MDASRQRSRGGLLRVVHRSYKRRRAAWLAIPVLLGSCRQTIGIDDFVASSAPQSEAPACELRRPNGCGACEAANCCAESAACAANASCNGFESCVAACGGSAECYSQCVVDHRVGPVDELVALHVCLATRCEKACGLQCGNFASYVAGPDGAKDCQSCTSASTDLCDNARSCARDVDCERYLLCRRKCVTGDCIGACSNDNPASSGMYTPFAKALQASCAQECQRGANWSCVGHVQWPTAQPARRELSVMFANFGSPNPIIGISVSMCGPGAECPPPPISTGSTNDKGAVTLVDTTHGINVDQGLNGFLQLSGPAGMPDGGAIDIYPTRVYWGFPLSEAQGRLGEPVPLLSTAQVSGIVSGITHATLDNTTGQIGVQAVDCLGTQALGVRVSISGADAGALIPTYLAQGFPSPSARQTDDQGIALFLNVPPGNYDIIAKPVALSGRESSKVSVYVHAGTLTEVALAPTPMP